MRDIRFKAKRKDNGEWIEGYYNSRHIVNWEEREAPVSVTESKKCKIQNMHTVIPETVCQYTGLKDKDGQEIWENDIIEFQFDNDDCPFPNKDTKIRIGRVFFSNFRSSFAIAMGIGGSDYINNDLFKYVQNGNRVKVIGNIFDNPDLIESR